MCACVCRQTVTGLCCLLHSLTVLLRASARLVLRLPYVKNLNCSVPSEGGLHPAGELPRHAGRPALLRCLRLRCFFGMWAPHHTALTNPPFVTSQRASAPHRGRTPTKLRLIHWTTPSEAELALALSGQQREPVLPKPVFMTILFTLALPPPRCRDYYFSTCPSRVGVSSFKVGLDATQLSTEPQGSQQCCKTVPLVHGELRRCRTLLFNMSNDNKAARSLPGVIIISKVKRKCGLLCNSATVFKM